MRPDDLWRARRRLLVRAVLLARTVVFVRSRAMDGDYRGVEETSR